MKRWIYTSNLGLHNVGNDKYNSYDTKDEAIASWYATDLRALTEKKQKIKKQLNKIIFDMEQADVEYGKYKMLFPEKFL